MRLFLEIGQRLQLQKRAARLVENAIASQGDKKTINKTVKDLQK